MTDFYDAPLTRTLKDTPMSNPDVSSVTHHRWDQIPAEPLKGTITRRLVTGNRMMIAHVYLKKGDDVPRHSHDNEQLTYILAGHAAPVVWRQR